MSDDTSDDDITGGEEGEGGEGLSKADAGKRERQGDALTRVDRKLFQIGKHGLQRLSRSSVSELEALVTTAHNAALPALERQLETLATLARRYLERDPLFTLDAWTATVNRAWLLTRVTQRRWQQGESPAQLLDIAGELRRSYAEVPETLHVQVLAAAGWVTDTGFVGVTVHFAVRERPGEVWSAGPSRPTMHFGEDPRALLTTWFSDYQQLSVADISHGAFELKRARVSQDGRLSFHKDLKIKETAWGGAAIYAPLAATSWRQLVERLRARVGSPLGQTERTLAFVEPAAWGKLTVDQVHSRATAPLQDRDGATLWIEVALRPENNYLLDNLEALLDPERQWPLPEALVGSIWVSEGRLKLFPLTALYEQPVQLDGRGVGSSNAVHLALEAIRYGRDYPKEKKRR